MTNKPFYADADTISRTDSGKCYSCSYLGFMGTMKKNIFGGQSGGGNTVGNLVITVAPHLIIWLIYTYVRRKMITLSGDGS